MSLTMNSPGGGAVEKTAFAVIPTEDRKSATEVSPGSLEGPRIQVGRSLYGRRFSLRVRAKIAVDSRRERKVRSLALHEVPRCPFGQDLGSS